MRPTWQGFPPVSPAYLSSVSPFPAPLPSPASPNSYRQALVAVTGLAAIYVLWRLDQGWMPIDDGMLAQAAQRLNAGELPHRDFNEPYTGGLTWLNAWAFRLLGERLWSIRVVLFAVFLLWIPTVQYIATRFLRPWHAAVVTTVSVAWSLPNYTAAMPSWYNLFFATFSAAALLKYVDDGRRRWLVAAGVAAGISVLFKIIGIFAIAAGFLSIVFLTREDPQAAKDERRRNVAYSAFVTACLLIFVAGLLGVVRQAFRAPEIVNFVLPGAMLAAALIWNEWRTPRTQPAPFRALLSRVVPFAIGAAIPIAIFLIPFIGGHGVEDLVRGVFILPQRRFEFSATPPLPLSTMRWMIPIAIAAWLLQRRRTPLPWIALVAIGLSLAAIVVISGNQAPVYRNVWYAIRSLPILVVGVAAWHLVRNPGGEASRDQARLAIVASILACCSLVQFPYSAPAYFCYAAPLFFLALLPWVKSAGAAAQQVAGLCAAFLVAFAVTRLNASPLQTMGVRYEAPWEVTPLPFQQGGIRVANLHALVYEKLVASLKERARGGYTWAGPDTPEIYFLSGLRNPTRSFYEFLDDSPDRDAATLRTLDQRGVTAIVVNRWPLFSPKLTKSMIDSLSQRYPRAQEFGPFVLMWRQ